MKEKTERILALIARPAKHSPLFWWMLENHDRIAEASIGTRMDWPALCAEFAGMGMTDTAGRPVTEANARKTWLRVRREKQRRDDIARAREAARESAAEARRSYPSRLPSNWRPESTIAGAARPISVGSGRAIVPAATGRSSGEDRAGLERLVRHPRDRQREVPQRGMTEGELRSEMSEKLPDGRLTPRAVELKLAWSAMLGRKHDQWLGVPQGMLVLEDELILVEFETPRQP